MALALKAALWLRVSTEGQNTDKDRVALLARADELGCLVTQVYDVTGSAWRGDHRQALEHLFANAEQGLFQVLLVTDLTRLSRQGGDETLAIMKRLERAGVQLRSLGDPEFSGPLDFSRRISAMIKGELAHEQSNWRSLAVRRGQAKARAEGKHLGRPKGSKDKRPRQRIGYRAEAARRRAAALAAKAQSKKLSGPKSVPATGPEQDNAPAPAG